MKAIGMHKRVDKKTFLKVSRKLIELKKESIKEQWSRYSLKDVDNVKTF
jgi:hypothetical protein